MAKSWSCVPATLLACLFVSVLTFDSFELRNPRVHRSRAARNLILGDHHDFEPGHLEAVKHIRSSGKILPAAIAARALEPGLIALEHVQPVVVARLWSRPFHPSPARAPPLS